MAKRSKKKATVIVAFFWTFVNDRAHRNGVSLATLLHVFVMQKCASAMPLNGF
jgi:hypothetical protein